MKIRNVDYFRTISVIVNRECGSHCPHCDLPRAYTVNEKLLERKDWIDLIDKACLQTKPEIIAIAAKEPLLPGDTRENSIAILRKGSEFGVSSGLVTNGFFAYDFLKDIKGKFTISYMDISIDGTPEIDKQIRGRDHFKKVDTFLKSRIFEDTVEKIFISTTLNKLNSKIEILEPLFEWIKKSLALPRVVLLVLYPNSNVEEKLWMADEDFLRILEWLTGISNEFEEIFIELFPSGLPGLSTLVEQSILPGKDEIRRDDTGMLWGYIDKNLFIRYENKRDLLLYHLQITPGGNIIVPGSLEKANYLEGKIGNFLDDDWKILKAKILERGEQLSRRVPRICLERKCLPLCWGENFRCPFIKNKFNKRRKNGK